MLYLLDSTDRDSPWSSLSRAGGKKKDPRIKLTNDRAWYTHEIYPFDAINQRKSYIIRRDVNQFESHLAIRAGQQDIHVYVRKPLGWSSVKLLNILSDENLSAKIA